MHMDPRLLTIQRDRSYVGLCDSCEPRDRQNIVVGVKTQSDKLALQLLDRPPDY